MNLDALVLDYERDGYAIVGGALGSYELAPLQEQWQRIRDDLRDGKTVDGMKRDTFYIHGLLAPPLGDVVRHPLIARIATRLLGPDVAVYFNRLNVKDRSFTDPIHLHQDLAYFNGKASKVNLFLALQHITLNNGAMVYVRGSHKLGDFDRATLDLSGHPELEVVVPSLSPGDIVIADIRLWHASVPNTSKADRVILQMMVQSAEDGSYYPLSIPKPTLIAGEWRTQEFIPWESPSPAVVPPKTSLRDHLKAYVPPPIRRRIRALLG